MSRLRIFSALVSVVICGSASAQQASSAQIAAGRDLALDRAKGNCIACHVMSGGDVPSSVGPELSDMRKRFPNRADLVGVLVNEEARNPQTAMPPFGINRILTPTEIESVVDFLYSL